MRLAFLNSREDRSAASKDQQLYLLEIPVHELNNLELRTDHNVEPWNRAMSFERATYLAVVPAEDVHNLVSAFRFLAAELPLEERALTVLVNRKTPPAEVRRFDGSIHSFICTAAFWQMVFPSLSLNAPECWCYECLAFVMSSINLTGRVFVRQLPCPTYPTHGTPHCPSVAVITPHRGAESYLRTVVQRTLALRHPGKLKLMVGLDVSEIESYRNLEHTNQLRLFRGSPAPVGPYVLRQAMIEASTTDLFMFQDSDDVPSTDRLEVLLAAMRSLDVDMIGCHEMEVNELDRAVRVYRFPLEVSDVLARHDVQGVSHHSLEPLLHATTLVNREKFLAAGGLSTNRRIANDSQFLLRAHFSMKIANVDEFLYLRRVHRHALTVADETRNGNDLRLSLSRQWGSDFKLVKTGRLRLENSSLQPTKHGPDVQVLPVPSAEDSQREEGGVSR
jgi:glycosyl transferase family 2